MSAPFEVAFVRALLHGACVGVTLPGARAELAPEAILALPAGLLAPEERAHALTLTGRRAPSWIGGRVALRRALDELGLAAAPALMVDDRGAPSVPAGFTGSISHKDTLAVAVAAPADGRGLGIDLEIDVAKPHVARHVLSERERARLGDDDGRTVTLAFAIKEAIYKAVDPFVRRYVGFHEVELEIDPAGVATRVTSALPFDFEVWWTREGGYILTTARASPR